MKNIRKQDEALVSKLTNSSVQRDKDQCLIGQTPVPVVTGTGVCEPLSPGTRKCMRCLRELPSSAFYMKDKRRTPPQLLLQGVPQNRQSHEAQGTVPSCRYRRYPAQLSGDNQHRTAGSTFATHPACPANGARKCRTQV